MILLDIEQRRFIKKGTNFLNTGWQLSKKKVRIWQLAARLMALFSRCWGERRIPEIPGLLAGMAHARHRTLLWHLDKFQHYRPRRQHCLAALPRQELGQQDGKCVDLSLFPKCDLSSGKCRIFAFMRYIKRDFFLANWRFDLLEALSDNQTCSCKLLQNNFETVK